MRGKKGVRSDGRAGLFLRGWQAWGRQTRCSASREPRRHLLGTLRKAAGTPWQGSKGLWGAELHWAAPGQGSPPQAALDGQTRGGGDTAAEATRKMPVQMCATRPSHRLWGCVLALPPPPHGWRRTRCAQRSCSREPWQGVGAAVEGILRSLKHALRCRFTESACPSAGRHAQGHPLGRGNAEATRTPVGARTHRT